MAAYDRKAATDPSGDLAVLQGIGPQDARTLVDFGAGTCAFALAAAPSCRRVAAVDVSLAMLTVLQARAEELGIRNVERVWGGLLSYQHQGEPADFVYSRNALHHLPDSWKALAPTASPPSSARTACCACGSTTSRTRSDGTLSCPTSAG